MEEHRIGTQEEWQAERDGLLREEKDLTRRSDELGREAQPAAVGAGGEGLSV